MDDELTIDIKTLKAIGAEKRVGILKALKARQKTQSELASELKLSKPAVLEHLGKLTHAGLVERLEEGRKWKYYRLTNTGRKIVGGSPLNVIVVLAISLMISLGSALFLWQQFSLVSFNPAETTSIVEENESPKALGVAPTGELYTSAGSSKAQDAASALAKGNASNISGTSAAARGISSLYPSIFLLAISLAIAGISIGYLIKK